MSDTPKTDADFAGKLERRLNEAEKIILMLTADHNTGPNYVQGFNEAQEYFAKYNATPHGPQHAPHQHGDVFLARVLIMKEPMGSIYLQAAHQLITEHGYVEAKRLAIQHRDMNSPGTFSFAHHNAVLKEINKAATCGHLGEE